MRGRVKKVTEDYVSTIFVGGTMVPPPQNRDQEQNHDYHDQVEASQDMLHPIPMLSKEVADRGDGRHPDCRSQEVEQGERFPWHAQDACQRPREDAETENEAGKKHGRSAEPGKQFLPPFQGWLRNPEEVPIAFQQRTSTIVAEGVSDIVADRRGAGGHYDNPTQIKLVFRVGEEAGQQERSFSGNRDAGVFTEQSERDRPVAMVGDEGSQEIEDGMTHSVTHTRSGTQSEPG